jgi:hypothetical protein
VSRSIALVLLFLSGLLLISGGHLSRRLMEDVGRREAETAEAVV